MGGFWIVTVSMVKVAKYALCVCVCEFSVVWIKHRKQIGSKLTNEDGEE